jgi:hypothetical protein
MTYNQDGLYDPAEVTKLIRWAEKARLLLEHFNNGNVVANYSMDALDKLEELIQQAKEIGI